MTPFLKFIRLDSESGDWKWRGDVFVRPSEVEHFSDCVQSAPLGVESRECTHMRTKTGEDIFIDLTAEQVMEVLAPYEGG